MTKTDAAEAENLVRSLYDRIQGVETFLEAHPGASLQDYANSLYKISLGLERDQAIRRWRQWHQAAA